MLHHPGNHPSLGPGHIDPTTAAQYAMVAGAGNGYDVYKGNCSLQTQSASRTDRHTDHSLALLLMAFQYCPARNICKTFQYFKK